MLHPTGAIFWQDQSVLLISDVHLGKVSHFRKFGAAVPRKAISRNFDMLNRAIVDFSPKTLCFLGDLFHSYRNNEWDLFEIWVKNTPQQMILVSGNHDIISPIKYESLGVRVLSEVELNGFLLTHHPEDREGFFNFSGHLHPAVRLRGKGRQSLRLPCFFKKSNQLILPAFGEFTGSHVLKPDRTDEIFAITKNAVLKITLDQPHA
jgi:DNA ligase-associated metallophosphoesterase